MDASQFDRLSKFVAATGGRRRLVRLLAVVPLAGVNHLLTEDSAAKRKRRNMRQRDRDRQHQRGRKVHDEKRKRKAQLCLDGESILASKKKKKKLLKQGATVGECPLPPAPPAPPAPPSPPAACTPESRAVTCGDRCGSATNNCGTAVDCGGCASGGECCQGTCLPSPWSYFGMSGIGTDSFDGTSGVAVSADGLTAWIADQRYNRVPIWTRPNANSTTWSYRTQIGTGAPGPGTDQLNNPQEVAISPDGLTAWIVEFGNNRVSVWKRPNASSTSWTFNSQLGTGAGGSGNNQFFGPSGVAVSPDGLTVWVGDFLNNRVPVWTRPDADSTNWSYSTQLGTGVAGSGNNQFYSPSGITVSPDGLTAYIADLTNSRIAVWTRPNASSTAWSYSTQLGAGTLGSSNNEFFAPSGVEVSLDGLKAWVADQGNNRISIWTRPNATSTTWSYSSQLGTGSAGSGNNQLNGPQGTAVSTDNQTVWVADFANDRIAVWKQQACPA